MLKPGQGLGADLGEEEAQGVGVRGGTTSSCVKRSLLLELGEEVVTGDLPE